MSRLRVVKAVGKWWWAWWAVGFLFPLWLHKVERHFALGKAVVKSALVWSAKGRAAGQGFGWLGVGVATLGGAQSGSGFAGEGRLSPKAALGYATPSAPAFAQSVPKARVGKGAVSPAGALQNGGDVCLPGRWRCQSAVVCQPTCRRVFVQAVGFAQPCVQRTRLRRGVPVAVSGQKTFARQVAG